MSTADRVPITDPATGLTFTPHALGRIVERHLTTRMVLTVLMAGESWLQPNGRTWTQGPTSVGWIGVARDNDGTIVTVHLLERPRQRP